MRPGPALGALGVALAAGARSLAPAYLRPDQPTPKAWPSGAAYASPTAEGPAGLPWRTMVSDAKLQAVLEQALAQNRDLRATVANIASARAQYRIQRSEQFPSITGGASASLYSSRASSASSNSYTADIGLSSFEIDLFGRLKNLSKAAFETYLATEAGARSTRIALIGDTATAYATLASDEDLLKVSQDTLASAQRSLRLTQGLNQAGLASQVDVQQELTLVAQAQSDIEQYTTQVAQDRNALDLLAGAPVDEALLPASLDALDAGIGLAPAGLSSTVLLQRPDVLQAEHQLIAANANVGAARAALFPTISLTAAAGVASGNLSQLFTRNALFSSASPAASTPLLGGSAWASLAYSKAQRAYYVAEYEKAVQSAFKDVANALARRGTVDRQRTAQSRLIEASTKSYQLALAQYRAGTGAFLNVLTAQRTLYSAKQTAIGIILADVSNRISLYQAIGSDDPVNK